MTIAHVYTAGLQALAAKQIDFVGDTVICALLTVSYVPNQDTQAYLSDLTGELTGGGYARSTLTTKTSTRAAGVTTLSCANVAFATFSANPGPRYAVFAVNTGVPTTSALLCWMDFEAATVVASQPATITIPGTGLLTLTAV